MERDEDLIEALLREIAEESGCRATVELLASVSSSWPPTRPGLLVFTFVCRHSGGEPQPGDDSLDAAWVEPAERARLHDGLAPSPGVVYRVYQGQGVDAAAVARHEV